MRRTSVRASCLSAPTHSHRSLAPLCCPTSAPLSTITTTPPTHLPASPHPILCCATPAHPTGAYGCTISGAGPTAVAVVPDPESGAKVAQAMAAAFEAAGLGVNSSSVVALDPQGAKFV